MDTEKHLQLNEMMSWSRGKHFVKFGSSCPIEPARDRQSQQLRRHLYFSQSLADYQNHTQPRFTEQQGSGHVSYWQEELGGFVQDDYRMRPNLSLSLGLRYNWQNVLRDDTQFAPRFAFAYSPDKIARPFFAEAPAFSTTAPGQARWATCFSTTARCCRASW